MKVRVNGCRLNANISQVGAFYASPLADDTRKDDWNNMPRSAWKQISSSPLTIDLGKLVTLNAFTYAPANGEAKPAMAFRYKFFVSADGKSWKEIPTSGEFSNIMHNPLPQTVSFEQKIQARYIKLDAVSPTETPAQIDLNEIGVTITE